MKREGVRHVAREIYLNFLRQKCTAAGDPDLAEGRRSASVLRASMIGWHPGLSYLRHD